MLHRQLPASKASRSPSPHPDARTGQGRQARGVVVITIDMRKASSEVRVEPQGSRSVRRRCRVCLALRLLRIHQAVYRAVAKINIPHYLGAQLNMRRGIRVSKRNPAARRHPAWGSNGSQHVDLHRQRQDDRREQPESRRCRRASEQWLPGHRDTPVPDDSSSDGLPQYYLTKVGCCRESPGRARPSFVSDGCHRAPQIESVANILVPGHVEADPHRQFHHHDEPRQALRDCRSD